MDGEAREISERLAQVEKSMRRYRTALAAVGLIAAVGLAGLSLVGAAKAPGVIQAKRFEVVDDNGMVRASLRIIGDDTGLAIYDKAGKTRVGLGTSGDITALALGDAAAKAHAFLNTSGDGTALTLADKAGKTRAFLDTTGDDTALTLADRSGKTRAFLHTSGDDTALSLYDQTGKGRAALGNDDLKITATGSTEHRAASSLVLLDERGRVLWEAP